MVNDDDDDDNNNHKHFLSSGLDLNVRKMASIRRSTSSQSARSHLSSSSVSTSLLMSLRYIFFHSRKHQSSSTRKNYVFRLVVFFVLGFILGFSPFPDLHHHRFFALEVEETRTADLVYVKKTTSRVIVSVRDDDTGIKSVELQTRKEDEEEGKVMEQVKKLLIIVTPTYNRAMQGYYLERLGRTLRLVPPPLLWVVVERGAGTMETADVLRRTGIMYRHLVCQMNSTSSKDMGVHQRNAALEHIERHRMDGIIYFADDDNVYSLELFERMRDIRRFGTWPVAMLAKAKSNALLEGPVCNGSQVIGWHTIERSKWLRRFHVDISGFAFNSTILWDSKRWQRPTTNIIRQLITVKEGFQEMAFIEQVVEDERQMEAIPSDCSKIMTWRLHLDFRGLVYPRGWRLSRNLETVIPLN